MKTHHLKLLFIGVPVLALLFLAIQVYYYIPYKGDIEEVTFSSNKIILSGIFAKPDGEGPHPVIVILHGSGPHTHNMVPYKMLTNIFNRAGFAVLSYDKRGTGKSEGDFEKANYADFIDDAMSGINFLKSRIDVDLRNIGLFGSSEGGWFTPQIANSVDNVSFVINRCGPPLSWEQTNLFELKNELLVENFIPNEINEILTLRKDIWDYYRLSAIDSSFGLGSERIRINSELEKYKDVNRDIPLPTQLPVYDQPHYQDIAYDYSYDPTPYIKAIDIPMLYIFAENDQNVPTEKAIDTLNAIMTQYHKDITIVVVPDVTHSLQNWTRISRMGYTKEYLELLGSWAKNHIR